MTEDRASDPTRPQPDRTPSRQRPGILSLAVGGLIAVILVPVLVLVLAGGPLLWSPGNPSGDRSLTAAVQIGPDGGYDVALTERQELLSRSELYIGGTVPSSFRLPDDRSGAPLHLRPAYRAGAATSGTREVQPHFDERDDEVELVHREHAEAGTHELTLDYRVTGAAVPVEEGVAVYVAALGHPDRYVIEAQSRILGIECLTDPPAAVPCGRQEEDGSWVVPRDLDVPGGMRVLVDADPQELVEPRIERG